MTTITQIRLSRSNCYLVQGEKSILIDTGNPKESKKIRDALRTIKLQLTDVALVIHTHGHSDHCGSTAELMAIKKIPTAIHYADSHMTVKGESDPTISVRLMSKILKPFVSKPFPKFKCDFEIDESFDLTEFGINGKVLSTPGHTNGSITIVFDNRKAIIGDVVMGGYFGGRFLPFKPDYHYYATDLQQVNKSIEKILQLDVDEYLVGHGGPLRKEGIEKWYKQNKRLIS